MKKAKIILALLVVFAVCFAFAACKPDKAEYTLDKTSLSLEEEQTHQLTVSSSLDNEFTVEYKTSNASVATVSASGLITAVKAGKAKITATVDGSELTCDVTVTAKQQPVEYVYELSEKEITVQQGGYKTLSVTVTPQKDISVTYESANTAIATVNANGRVTGVAIGETTVTAKVDGKNLTCKVTVEKAPPTYTLAAEGSPLVEEGKTLILQGATQKFVVTSSDQEDVFSVVWSTSNEQVATVAQDGTVTAVAEGDVTVTAKIGNVTKTANVKVFTYHYDFASAIALEYGDTDAKLTVSVDHGKTLDISYEYSAEDIVEIDEEGNITIVGVGTVTVTIKDGEATVGTCEITVSAVYSADETLQMHVGDEKTWTVTVNPEGTKFTAVYEVVEGESVVSIDTDGKINALANGTAKVTATIGETVLTCDVLVNNVNASGSTVLLDKDRNNPIDITDGAEYWEQYIANGEVNHKHYVTSEEDIITKTSSVDGKYLSDYAAFLAWNGGATSETCNCGHCNKDTQNGGDGGWTDGGNKAMCVDVKNAIISLNVKLYAGESVIKVYTGGYNLVGRVQLKADGVVIAEQQFDNRGAHNSQLVTFAMNVAESCNVTIELSMIDDYGDAGHSVISLAAVSVSGDVYQLEEGGKRLAPEGQAEIVLKKNGTALTEGVTCTIIEGQDVVSLEGNVVTAIKMGTAKIAVTADGRTRIYNVEVGYAYSLNKDEAQLHVGGTHQIAVTSDPEGAQITAAYVSENTAVATVDENGLVTAVANGEVIIKVTIDETVLEVKVVVAVANVEYKNVGENEYLDLSGENVAYWEQYINNEINYKAIKTPEEDVIERIFSEGHKNYLPDFIWLKWTGGQPTCPKPSKPDGFREGTLLGVSGQSAEVAANINITLNIKVAAGQTTIKLYAGAFKCHNVVTLSNGEEVLATYDITPNGGGQRKAVLTFDVDMEDACTLTLKLKLQEPTADNSFITIGAVSVSGDTYQLEKASERVAPNGTAQIVINKNGTALTSGVEYEVVTEEGATALATVDGNGLVTAGAANGTVTVKVTAEGRVRYFTLEIGYEYGVDKDSVTLKPNETHKIVVASNPVGSTETVTYTSDNETVATVSETGLVMAVGNGTATITAEVEGQQFVITIMVSGIAVTTEERSIAGEFIDLTQDNVIYYEHCLWNELATKKLAEGEKDLIDLGTLPADGNDNYEAYMYFADADGAKSASGNDKAYKKYTKIATDYEVKVTIPVGTYEIRVYTGAYNATLNTSLILDGQTLGSCKIESPNGRTTNVVTFTVTVEEETVFKVLMALNGELNRFAGVAIATPYTKKDATTTLTGTATETEGDTTTKVNLTEKGNLDWIYYNTEFGGGNNGNIAKKANGNYINNEVISIWNEWDYRAGLTYTDGEFAANAHPDGDTGKIGESYHNNFVADESRLLATVKVDENVKTITIYATGYQSSYKVFAYDSKGNLIIDQVVCPASNESSRAFEITLNVTATEAETIRVGICKVDGNNLGIAAIAVAGEVIE